jgi:outer membrane protein TolC
LWELNPSIQAINELAESAKHAEDSAASGLWPKFQVSAKSSIDYPNGPVLESFNQNYAGVSMSWPLFENNMTRNVSKEKDNLKNSTLEMKNQAASDLKRDWDKTLDQMNNLFLQKELNSQIASESEELSGIVYESYRAGSLTYIEVQDANYKLLEAKIALARTKVQILLNLALLASMSE